MIDRVHERICRAITEQRLPPGAKLGEEALASVFRVSRARIRQVLHRLAHERTVELRPHRGAYVAQLSTDEARDVFTARRIVEAHTVERAGKGLTPGQRGQLARHLAAERAAHGRRDRGAAIRLSGEFHLLLAGLGGNRVLARFLADLVSRTSLVIALYEGPGRPCCAVDEHGALVELLGAGRVQEAVDLMDRHLLRIEARLDLEGPVRQPVDLGAIFADAAPGAGAR